MKLRKGLGSNPRAGKCRAKQALSPSEGIGEVNIFFSGVMQIPVGQVFRKLEIRSDFT